jgi:hypothetical protein
MPHLLAFFPYLALALRLQTVEPALDTETAYRHVAAAYSVANDKVSPELLLAIAYVESRFDPTATSRVVDGQRRLGSYPSTEQPAMLNARAGLYCGPLQTMASSWQQCMAQRDLTVAYTAGAAELHQWLADPRVRGDVPRALAGHGCGNIGVTTGKCNGYSGRVMWMERKLRRGDLPRTPREPREQFNN